MKSEVEKISPLQRKLNIEVPVNAVQSAFEKVFSDIQKNVEIKGFRKGKAPMTTIKSIYTDRVKQDVVQELIQKHYSMAISEHALDPISYPEFEFDELAEGKNFSFTAAFDIRPEIKLKKYEGLEVLKEKFAFAESQIDQVLENIRKSKATFQDLFEPRPAQVGDMAVVDFEGFVDGAPLENGTGTDHQLELGSNSFIEGFEEGIVGMSVGGTATLRLKFPDPYHAADLAGKPVEFKVTLKALKKKVLPEITEEFVKSLGGPTSLEDLKKTIREDIEGTDKKRIDEAFKKRMLKKVVEENPVEVPLSLMKEQKAALVEDFKKRMSEQGMTDADFSAYVQKWDKDFENSAAEMIKSSFLVDAIAKKHDLISNNGDLDRKFAEYAQQTGITEDRIREFYGKPEQLNRLTYSLTEEKVMDFLMKTAKIKEVDKKDLKEEEQ